LRRYLAPTGKEEQDPENSKKGLHSSNEDSCFVVFRRWKSRTGGHIKRWGKGNERT